MTPDIKLPDLSAVQTQAAPINADAKQVLDLIRQSKIETPEQIQTAVVWIADVKEQHADIVKIRDGWTKPLDSVIDSIKEFFQPAINSLAEVETLLKGKIQERSENLGKERDALLAYVHIAGNRQKKAKIIEAAEARRLPKISGLQERETWGGMVQDAGALIDWCIANDRRDLLEPNQAALKALTKAAKADPGIPGWIATAKRSAVVTPSRVKR